MKRIIAVAFICALAHLAFSQNFGIDVASPEAKLHVQRLAGSNQATVYVDQYANNSWGHVMKLRTHTTGNDGPKLLFINRDIKNWSIGGQESGTGFGIYEDGGDGTHGSGFGTNRFMIIAGGNVGIGTSSPQAKLEVIGDARFGCRSGFWAVGDGRLCMQDALRGPNTMHAAIADCQNQGPGSRVCEHNDMRQACGAGFNPYGGQGVGWYGDHGVASGGNWDDEFGTWNRGDCGDPNNDGPAQSATDVSYYYRCCY